MAKKDTSTIGNNNTGDSFTPKTTIGGKKNPLYHEGNNKNNKIKGKPGNDTMFGKGGNDTLLGENGNDQLSGDAGNDSIKGGKGNDSATGGAGNDRLYGEDGNDALYGDAGNDSLSGGAGNDKLFGGTENDILLGDDGNDTLDGGAGLGTLDGGAGNDSIKGGTSADSIVGGLGNDKVTAGDGNDTITGGDGNDTIDGGNGDDTYIFLDNAGTDAITDISGTDTFDFTAVTTTGITADLTAGTVGGTGIGITVTGDIETLLGGSGDDTVSGKDGINQNFQGNAGDDSLTGASGNDSLDGGEGDDTLIGGSGTDSLVGGGGDDTFTFGNGFGTNETVQGGEGHDATDFSTKTSAITVNLNDGTATDGSNSIADIDSIEEVIGSQGNDSIRGGSGEETLTGGLGDDTLVTGGGADALTGNAGDDMFVISGADIADGTTVSGGGDTDTLDLSSNDQDLTVNLTANTIENEDEDELEFSSIEKITTGDGNDAFNLASSIGSYTLDGGAGDNTVDASLTGSRLTFTIEGNDGTIADTENSVSFSTVTFSNVANLTGGSDNDTFNFDDDFTNHTIDGNGGDDSLNLDASDNNLSFSFVGNEGTVNDSENTIAFSNMENHIGGSGNDTFAFDASFETVSISGGSAGTDAADFSASSSALNISFTGSDDGTVTSTNSVTFTNIDQITAGSGNDTVTLANDFATLTIAGGSGTDTLTATSTDSDDQTITYTSAQAGTIEEGSSTVTFTSTEHLTAGNGNDTINVNAASDVTVDGGAGNDTFNVTNGYAAGISIMGGSGTNTLNVADTSNQTLDLTSSTGTITDADSNSIAFTNLSNITTNNGDDTITFATGVGEISVDSGSGNDTFTVAEGFGNGNNLIAGLGVDTVTVNDSSNLTVTLTEAGNGTIVDGSNTITFSGLESITTSTGNDTYTFNDNFGPLAINGVSGSDAMDFSANDDDDMDISFSGTNNGTVDDGDNTVTFYNFDAVTTGDANDTFITMNDGGSLTLAASGGTDTLNAVNDDSDSSQILVFSDNQNGTIEEGSNTVTYTSIENITLGAGADTVNFSTYGGMTVDSGSGDDSFTFADNFVDNNSVMGGDGTDTITIADSDDALNVTYTGATSGTIANGGNSIDFTGVENITTGTASDTFIFNDNFATHSVDGTSGVADALNFSANDDHNMTITFTNTDDGTASDGINTVTFANFDIISTGDADDTFTLLNDNASFTISASTGTDTINATNTDSGTAQTLSFEGTRSGTIVENTNTITFSGVEHITLGAGADTVNFSDYGSMTVDGGSGNDTFNFDDDFSSNSVIGGDGTDTIVDADTGDQIVSITSANSGTIINELDETISFSTIDVISTSEGNDTFNVSSGLGAITLSSGDGDDTFNLNGDDFGDDISIIGGEGTDTINDADADNNGDNIDFTGDNAGTLLDGNTVTFTGIEQITSGGGADLFTFNTTSNNSVDGAGGNDIFVFANGYGNNNSVIGGTQSMGYGDSLRVEDTDAQTVNITANGAGTIVDGSNTITFSGIEEVTTNAGNDTINFSTHGSNTVDAGSGNDTFTFANGFGNANSVIGGTGTDTVIDNDNSAQTIHITADGAGTIVDGSNTIAFSGIDSISTSSGADAYTIDNGVGNMTLNGATGDNTFTFAGNDHGTAISVIGGSGTDTVSIADTDNDGETVVYSANFTGTAVNSTNTLSFDNVEVLSLGGGNDAINLANSNGGVTVDAGAGDDSFTLGMDYSDSFSLIGGSGTDTLNSTTFGGDQTITLSGVQEGSISDGGTGEILFTGIDVITSGEGNDTFTFNASFGALSIDGDSGASDKMSFSASTNALTVSFTGIDDGTVADSNNTVTFANFEQITTGSGNDTFTLTNDFDNFTILASGGTDTIIATSNDSDAQTLAYDGGNSGTIVEGSNTVTFTAVENITLGDGDDSISFGNFSSNTADGGAGDDTFTVTNVIGNNRAIGNTGTDTLIDNGNSAQTIAITADGSGTIIDGSNTITFTGIESISTSSGNDAYSIGTSAGNMTLNAGTGANTFTFANDYGNGISIVGGANNDSIIDNDTSSQTVAVTATGVGTIVDGSNTVTFSSVESISTSSGNDTFNISSGVNSMTLNAGNGTNTFNFTGDSHGYSITAAGGTDTDTINITDGDNSGESVTYTSSQGGNIIGNGSGLDFSAIDHISLGGGNDTVSFSTYGSNTIDTGAGNDTFTFADGYGNANSIIGGLGTDTLVNNGTNGQTVAVTANGGGTIIEGSNTITFSGIESISTSSGNDTYTIANGVGNMTLNAGSGNNSFTFNGNDHGTAISVAGSTGTDTLTIADANNDGETVVFSSGLTGTSINGSNTLSFSSIDHLTLGGGNDTVDLTSASTVTVDGGAGNDSFTLGDDYVDGFSIIGGLGTDTLNAAASDEEQTITMTAAQDGTIVATGIGDATFTGIDVITSGIGADIFIFNAAFGNLSIDAISGTDDKMNFSASSAALNVSFTGSDDGTVADSNNTVTFANFDQLTTGSGNDTFTMANNFGNFTIAGGNGTDTITATNTDTGSAQTLSFSGANNGTITEGAGHTITFTGIENVTLGSGSDTVNFGTYGAMTVDAGSGSNTFLFSDEFADNNSVIAGAGTDDVIQINGSDDDLAVTFTASTIGSIADGSNVIDFSGIEHITTGSGNDTFTINDSYLTYVINANGGTDTLNFSNVTNNNLTVTFSGVINGSVNNGTNAVSFSNFEAITGGTGNDTFTMTNDFTDFTIAGGSGTDTLRATNTDAGSAQTLSFSGSTNGTVTEGAGHTITFTGIENVTLGAGNDTIDFGTHGAMTVDAGTGDNTFNFADGFADDNSVAGGTGADVLNVAASVNQVVAVASTGTGTITAGGNVIAFSGIETISTNNGNDSFDVSNGVGGLQLIGGNGDNSFSFTGDHLGDDLTVVGGTGTDTVGISDDDESGISVTFSGDNAGTATDGSNDLTFTGVEAVNLGGGNDTVDFVTYAGSTVSTGLGDDTFTFADGFGDNNSVIGGGGDDTLDVSASNDNLSIDLSGAGAGTIADGGNVIDFTGIESIITGAGSDTFTFNDEFGDLDVDGGSTGGSNALTFNQVEDGLTINITVANGGTAESTANTITFSHIDTIIGSQGDDIFSFSNDTGDMTIEGGAGVNTLEAANTDSANAQTVTFTDEGEGDITEAGGGTINFSEIDEITLGAGSDTVNFGTYGAMTVDAGSGNNTFNFDDEFADNNSVIGGSGTDTINVSGSDDSLTVSFSGVASGTVVAGSNVIDFSGVENITSGSGNDAFTFNDGYGTHAVNATSGDEDVLNFGNVTGDNLTVTFNGVDDGAVSDNANVVTFSNFDQITTSDGNDSFVFDNDHNTVITIAAGSGDDTLNFSDLSGNVVVNLGTGNAYSTAAGTAEFQANTFTTGQQYFSASAGLTGGGYVVVWQSDLQDGSFGGVYGQLYNAAGLPEGDEFRVNTQTMSGQTTASVTALTNGGFVVTWESYQQESGHLFNWGIFGQQYDANGVADVNGEFQVNTTIANDQRESHVAALADGGYVVVWESFTDGDGNGIYGQRYAADGTPDADGEFLINTTLVGEQRMASVAGLQDGGFVVVWKGPDSEYNGVYFQRFDASGNVVGSETIVNSTETEDQNYPAVSALTGGGFVVVWQSSDGSQADILMQRFDASGNVVGSETIANQTTSGDQITPVVAALAGGGYVVIWENTSDGSSSGIYGQVFNADGSVNGTEFRANATTTGTQTRASVTALSDGGFIVTWDSDDQDGSDEGIFGQRFDADGNAVGTGLNVDFTSIETVIGGSSDDTFVVGNGFVDASINGGNGDDTLIVQDTSYQSVSISSTHVGTVRETSAGTISFSSIEVLSLGDGSNTININETSNLTIYGGAGGDGFGVNGDHGDNVSLIGGDGYNTIQVESESNHAETVTFTSNYAGTIVDTVSENTVSFSEIEYIDIGSDSGNTFIFQGADHGAVTVSTDMDGESDTNTITIADTNNSGETVSYSDSHNGTIVGNGSTITFTGIDRITLGDGNDTVNLNGTSSDTANAVNAGNGNNTFNFGNAYAGGFTVTGGTGTDNINFSTSTFGSLVTFTSGGDGTIDAGNGITFENVENITSGAGDDTFILDDYYLAHSFEGNDGTDRLNFVNLTGKNLTVTFTGTDDGTVNDGFNVVTFANFEAIDASDGNDSFTFVNDFADFTVSAGDGTDTITATNTNFTVSQTVTLSASNAGTISEYNGGTISFTGVENITLGDGEDTVNFSTYGSTTVDGGSGDDTFTFANGFANGNSVTGGSGTDTLNVADSSAQTIAITSTGNGTITEGSNVITFVGIESISTNNGNDTYNVSAGVEDMLLNGGNGNNTFNFSFSTADGNGDGLTVTGGSGTDTINITESDTPTRTITLDESNNGTMVVGSESLAFNSIDAFTLTGGNDNFVFEGDDHGNVSIKAGDGEGNDGTNTITVVDEDESGETLTFNGSSTGSIVGAGGTINFDLISSVTLGGGDDTINFGTTTYNVADGGDGDDTFNFADNFGMDNIAAGGSGTDTIDASGFSTAMTVSITTATIVGGGNNIFFSGIEAITTGTGDDIFNVDDNFGSKSFNATSGFDSLNLYPVTGDNLTITFTGDFAGTATDGTSSNVITFSNFDAITAGDGNDSFTFANDFDNFTIAGGGGTDSVTATNTDSGSAQTLTFSAANAGTIIEGSGHTISFSDITNITLGTGSDSLTSIGTYGGNSINAGAGDDTFTFVENFLVNTVIGGDGTDTLDFGASDNDNLTVTFSDVDAGTISDGTNAIAFDEVESITTADGDDSFTFGNSYDLFAVDGSDARDTLTVGSSDDTLTFTSATGGTLTAGAGHTISFSNIEEITVGGGNDILNFNNNYVMTLDGGDGDDTFNFADNFVTSNSVVGGTGTDTINTALSDDDLIVTFAADTDTGSILDNANAIVFSGVENITSGTGDDTFAFVNGIDDNAVDATSGSADAMDFSSFTAVDLTVNFTGIDDGTVKNSTNTVTFYNFDEITTSTGNDTFNFYEDFASFTVVAGAGSNTLTLDGNDDDDAYLGLSNVGEGIISADGATISFTDITHFTLGGGDDTIDLGFHAGHTVNAGDGDDTFESVGNAANTLQGGDDDDTFTVVDGYASGVVLNGGDEDSGDELDVRAVTADVTVNLNSGSVYDGSTTITISDFEIVRTGGGADVITDTSGGETIYAGAGNDTINSSGGGGDIYTSDDDALNGEAGNDLFVLASIDVEDGSTYINGGADTDTLDITDIDNVVHVDLQDGTIDVQVSNEIYTIDNSASDQQKAQTIRLTNGNIVTVYQSDLSTNQNISGRIYSLDDHGAFGHNGYGLDESFTVNTTLTGAQVNTSAAALTGGGFVVVWQDDSEDGLDTLGSGIILRVYDEDGDPVTGEILVPFQSEGAQTNPTVTGLSDGTFLVTWQYTDPTLGEEIFGRRFNADGTATSGSDIQINFIGAGDQTSPAISALSGGGYVVVWTDAEQEGSDGSGIYARIFNGADVGGGEIHINTTTAENQTSPAVTTLTGGNFVVTWASELQDGNGLGVYASIFDGSGILQGTEFRVNTITTGNQYDPSIVALTGGGFVITWTSDEDIYGQMFDASGNAVGEEIEINSGSTGSEQVEPSVIALADGGFLVTWTSNASGNNDIFSRQFNSDGEALHIDTPIDFATSSIEIFSLGDGADEINFGNLGNHTVYGGSGIDTFTVGNNYGNANSVNGQGGNDILIVEDTSAQTVVISASGDGTVTDGNTFNTIDFTNIQNVTTNSGADHFTFDDGIGGMTVNGAGGNDSFTLGIDDFGTGINLQGGDDDDTIHVVNDDNDPNTVTLTANNAGTIVSDGNTVNFSTVEAISLFGTQGDTINLGSYGGVSIDAGDGADTFAIATDDIGAGNSLIGGDGNDSITFASASASYTINVTSANVGTITRNGNTSNFSSIETISAGAGGASFTFENDAGSMTIANGNIVAKNTDGTDVQTLTYSTGGDGTISEAGKGTITFTGTYGVELGAGNDIINMLTGTIGEKSVRSGDGNDTFNVGGDYQNDIQLRGDSGTDTLDFSTETAGRFVIDLSNGGGDEEGQANTTDYQNRKLTIFSIENAVGGSQNDSITGSDVANSLSGSGGDDTLIGEAGNDTLVGGMGDDVLQGGADDDTYVLDATSGDDFIDDLSGTDTLDLGALDALNMGFSRDDTTLTIVINTGVGLGNIITIHNYFDNSGDAGTGHIESILLQNNGVQANFTLTEVTDRLGITEGDIQNDAIVGTVNGDTLLGGDGNDLIYGLAGNDHLVGGFGDDTIVAGAGLEDLVDGGDGNDTLGIIADSASTITIDFDTDTVDDGTNTVTFIDIEAFNVIGSSDTDVLQFTADDDLTITFTSATAGSIYNGTNSIVFSGIEVITGGTGDDTFVIESNYTNHTIDGSTGNDTLDFSAVTKNITISDITNGSGTATYPAANHTVTFTGIEAIIGGSGTDSLIGGAGNQTLNGGTGSDTLVGGTGDDTFAYTNGFGADGSVDGGDDTDTLDFSAYTTAGVTVSLADGNADGDSGNTIGSISGIENVIGSNTQGDTITGDGNANSLSGGGGNDTLEGGTGNDSLLGGTGDDRYEFVTGFDQDLINDTGGSSDILDFNDLNSGTFFTTFSRADSDTDLVITVGSNTVTVNDFFDNSGYQPGIGFIETIIFNDTTYTEADYLNAWGP